MKLAMITITENMVNRSLCTATTTTITNKNNNNNKDKDAPSPSTSTSTSTSTTTIGGLVLSVHDELLFEVPEEELDEMAGLIRDCMENICVLRVPLRTSIKVGKRYGSLSSYSPPKQKNNNNNNVPDNNNNNNNNNNDKDNNNNNNNMNNDGNG